MGPLKAGTLISNHFFMDGVTWWWLQPMSMVKIWGSHHPIEATIYKQMLQVPGGPTFLNVMIW